MIAEIVAWMIATSTTFEIPNWMIATAPFIWSHGKKTIIVNQLRHYAKRAITKKENGSGLR